MTDAERDQGQWPGDEVAEALEVDHVGPLRVHSPTMPPQLDELVVATFTKLPLKRTWTRLVS